MKKFTLILLQILILTGITFSQNMNKEEILKLKHDLISKNQIKSGQNFLLSTKTTTQSVTQNEDFGTAPDLNWLKEFGGSGDDYGNAITTDADGNVYIAGYFSSKITVESNTYTSVGVYDAFVAKFDNTGNLTWFNQLSASANEEIKAYGICLDASNNIYVTGSYTGSVTLGSTDLPNNADINMFLAKFNSSGTVELAKNHGTTDDTEIGLKIDIDDSGNIYIVGATSTFDITSHYSIIIKYDASGNETWVQEYKESFNDIKIFNDSIYYAGTCGYYFTDDGYLNNGVRFPIDYLGIENAFVAKSDLDGNFIWAASSGLNGEGIDYGECYGQHISIDDSENIYLAGKFSYGTCFGDDTIHASSNSGYIAKCSSTGTFQWARYVGGSNGITGIATDDSNNSYVTFSNNVTKYDTDGNELFWEPLDDTPIDINMTSSNKIVTVGSNNGLMYLSQFDNTVTEEWSTHFDGDAGSAEILGMVSDDEGNVYTYGNTTNTISYLGETFDKGIFICKQDPKGDLIWSNQFPNVNITVSTLGEYINIDTINNRLYITGNFSTDLKINETTTLTPAEYGSVFVLKYDLDGNYIWSIQEDFKVEEPSVIHDYNQNVILSGTFKDETINIGNTQLTNSGAEDGFLAKYESDGNFSWAIKAGGDYTEFSTFASVDENNDIYLTGEFTSENISIGETDFTLNSGDGNIVLAKLDNSGNVLWYKIFGASATEETWTDYTCWPTGIITDTEGYSYVKGWHGDSVYFGDHLLRSPYYLFSFFLSKLDPTGNIMWIKSIDRHSSGYDYNQFDMDRKGSIYLGFSSTDTVSFGENFVHDPSGKNDLLVAKYLNDGTLDWVKSFASNEEGKNRISSVAVYDTSNVFVSGYYERYLSVDDQILTTINKHGFVAMFGDEINQTTGVKDVYNRSNKQLSFYPNPSAGVIYLNTQDNFKGDIDVINLSGQIVHSEHIESNNQPINLNNLSPGVYFVRVKNNSNYTTEKLIIE